jgi:hypothetical protein
MEFTAELFKCQTCDGEHTEFIDVLILPPPDQPQNAVPFAICGCCAEALIGTDVEDRAIVLDLH